MADMKSLESEANAVLARLGGIYMQVERLEAERTTLKARLDWLEGQARAAAGAAQAAQQAPAQPLPTPEVLEAP